MIKSACGSNTWAFGSLAGAESLLLAFDQNAGENAAPSVVMAEAPHGTAPRLQGKNVANLASFAAVFPTDGNSRHDLLMQADVNLYRSKFGGAVTAGWNAYNISSDVPTGVGA